MTLDGERSRCENPRSFRLKVTAGPHTIGLSRARSSARRRRRRDLLGLPRGRHVHDRRRRAEPVITGPLNTDRHRRHAEPPEIFTCRPKSAADEATCARSILSTLARRAYRGPVSAARVRHADGRSTRRGAQAGDFESGIQEALARMLVAPRFVYRAEEEPATVAVRCSLSRQRCRARLASVVLPVEQHPGR